MSETGWNIGTGRYIQRPNPRLTEPTQQGAQGGRQQGSLGFTWDSSAVPWSLMSPVETPRALARFQKQLAGHVWDAAALEGNPYTLPEVQTLLEGVTVGGHRLDDEKQVLALAESTRLLHDLVQDGRFVPNRSVSDRIHGLVAPHEAIEAGHFRGEGSVRGGGTVNLGEYGTFQATQPAFDNTLPGCQCHTPNGIHHRLQARGLATSSLPSNPPRPSPRAVHGSRPSWHPQSAQRTSAGHCS